MKLEYRFVNGEKAIIEISGDFEKIMKKLDDELENNNTKESIECISLSYLKNLTDESINPEKQILKQIKIKALYKAISELKPDEQELIHKIYLSEACVSLSEYAQSINVSENAVKQRLKRIRKKLKLICSNARLF